MRLVFTTAEAAHKLGCTEEQVFDLFAAELLSVYIVGGNVFFKGEDIDALLHRGMRCAKCVAFFRKYKCNAPHECDCPKCQGLCSCREETT